MRRVMIDPYHPIMGFTAWVLRENSAEKHSGGTDEVLRIKPNDRTGTEERRGRHGSAPSNRNSVDHDELGRDLEPRGRSGASRVDHHEQITGKPQQPNCVRMRLRIAVYTLRIAV